MCSVSPLGFLQKRQPYKLIIYLLCSFQRTSPTYRYAVFLLYILFQSYAIGHEIILSNLSKPNNVKLNTAGAYAASILPKCRPKWHPRTCLGVCLPRKEVIQPHLPIRLPCYDFTPVIGPTFGSSLLTVGSLTSGVTDSHGVTGGVYKTRERIHRDILIRDY